MKAHVPLSILLVLAVAVIAAPASGPLSVHPDNPRYFADASGKAVLLTGSHTWNTIVDMSPSEPPATFDYSAFLDWAAGYGHNFIRLWAWELTTWSTQGNSPKNRVRVQVHNVAPHPWLRTGPGMALDGKPKFDLTQPNTAYYERIRSRAEAAGRRGFYVSLMLFEGWGIRKSPEAWKHHPMNPANNVNGVDADTNRDGEGLEIHRLGNRVITRLQEEVARQVIDAVNDLDNVLYEIANEAHPDSTPWQYHMIRFVKEYEQSKPKQHPVGMTYQQRGGLNSHLFASPADWISPGKLAYRSALFRADGSKVILNDTDHLWGIGGTVEWAWKSFLQGMNPIFMDPYDGVVLGNRFDPRYEPLRRTMGQIARLSRELDLEGMEPMGELASTGYCLGAPGKAYVSWANAEEAFTLDLTDDAATFEAVWIDPETGAAQSGDPIRGGNQHRLAASPEQADDSASQRQVEADPVTLRQTFRTLQPIYGQVLHSLRLWTVDSSLPLRVSALAVLVVGLAGLGFKEMASFEAGRLYVVALGLYLIAPAAQLDKQKRYLFGVICLTLALGLIALQFIVRMV